MDGYLMNRAIRDKMVQTHAFPQHGQASTQWGSRQETTGASALVEMVLAPFMAPDIILIHL